MKMLALSMIVSSIITANVFASEEPYTYSAGLVSTPPVIDGIADDEAWISAQQTSRFVYHQDNSSANVGTWAKVAYDSDNLYILYEAMDSDLVSTFTGHDQPTYEQDDTVEVFLDPDGDGKNYYEIGASLSASYDEVIISIDPWVDDDPWNVQGYEYAVTYSGTINDDSDKDLMYTVEMKIPLSSLNYTGNKEFENKLWRFNLFRAEYSTSSETWVPNGWLSWSPVGSFGFHQPERFAYLEFIDVPLWKPGTYNNFEKVSYKGKVFEARFNSVSAPGLSGTDGWRVLSEEPHQFNDNLFYTKGDTVEYLEQIWIAKWNSQGQLPNLSQDWDLIR